MPHSPPTHPRLINGTLATPEVIERDRRARQAMLQLHVSQGGRALALLEARVATDGPSRGREEGKLTAWEQSCVSAARALGEALGEMDPAERGFFVQRLLTQVISVETSKVVCSPDLMDDPREPTDG